MAQGEKSSHSSDDEVWQQERRVFCWERRSNPLLTKHLEQYECWSEKCYFWRNVNPKTKSEAKNITFCAEDDILAIQMLRQECGVSSEKIRQRADVRDVVACHASLVLTRKGYDLRLVCLCDASSASRLVRFDRRHASCERVTVCVT